MALLAPGAGLFGANSFAHEHEAHRAQPAASQAGKAAAASVRLIDRELTNQDGKSARFKSDVVGERIVVVDNIYTSCTTICPILTTIMVNVHNKIGERARKEVSLVSLSVDPVTDTPQRLRAYARRHKAQWNLWTGSKTAMDQVLKGLGIYAPDYTDHPSSILVGDGKTGEWTRFYAFASPEQILKRVDELLAARQNTTIDTGARR
ncbi:MAG: SCO family protein [Betaproteobacteria bacterium]|nr:SCO family protein [Betaproteobacteria bacterium]